MSGSVGQIEIEIMRSGVGRRMCHIEICEIVTENSLYGTAIIELLGRIKIAERRIILVFCGS